MSNNKSNRQFYIDQVSGLLILYMIVYHIFQWSGLGEVNESYLMYSFSFFMFWFFYKSGMFYREKTCKEIIFGGGKKLIVPFVVFSIVGNVIQCARLFVSGDYNWVHLVLTPCKSIVLNGSCGGNLPLWFLFSLLAVQLLYSGMRKNLNDLWIVALSLIVAFSLFKMKIHTPLYLGNISLGLVAYSFGHLMRDWQYKRVCSSTFIVFYSLLLFIHPYSIDFRANEIHDGYYLVAVLFSLSGCIFINNLFKRIPYRISLLEKMGKQSMDFYVLHWIILSACNLILPFSRWDMFVVMIIASAILLRMFIWLIRSLHFQWVFGEK